MSHRVWLASNSSSIKAAREQKYVLEAIQAVEGQSERKCVIYSLWALQWLIVLHFRKSNNKDSSSTFLSPFLENSLTALFCSHLEGIKIGIGEKEKKCLGRSEIKCDIHTKIYMNVYIFELQKALRWAGSRAVLCLGTRHKIARDKKRGIFALWAKI